MLFGSDSGIAPHPLSCVEEPHWGTVLKFVKKQCIVHDCERDRVIPSWLEEPVELLMLSPQHTGWLAPQGKSEGPVVACPINTVCDFRLVS